MARGVRQWAKRANDNVRANRTRKFSKVGPRLGAVSQCSVEPNDLVREAHDTAQIFKTKLSSLMGNVNDPVSTNKPKVPRNRIRPYHKKSKYTTLKQEADRFVSLIELI